MGGSEIIVILIVALVFLGPDKLPSAAKSISKGIRDIKKQSRALQEQIEGDEQIGGAIRDLKSALRGDDFPVKPKPLKPRIKELADGAATVGTTTTAATGLALGLPTDENSILDPAPPMLDGAALEVSERSVVDTTLAVDAAPSAEAPRIRMSPTAGEPGLVEDEGDDDDLASLIKPAAGTVAKGS